MPKSNILIVDDEASVRRLLEKVFVNEGYEVMAASSGEEAIDLIRQKGAYLALVDLKMPGIGGIETIREIKKINMGVSFIVITAFGEMSSVKEATELGVFDYVTKPFDLEYVKNLARHIIESLRPRTLPYGEDMKQVFGGRMTLEEARKRKLDAFRDDVEDRRQVLKDLEKYLDKEVAKYYEKPRPLEFLRDRAKKLFTNFYFIIITLGIIIGIAVSYVQGAISQKRAYSSAAETKKVTPYDFYKALSELKYWMRTHTEQGIRGEKEAGRLK